MELTIKKNFDLTKNTLQHKIVLDTIELLSDKPNFTVQEVTTMAYIAILHNVCEEDVVKLVFEDTKEQDFWTLFSDVIEPKALEVLGGDQTSLYNIIGNVCDYKHREIDINGKFFYAVQELIKQLSELDTNKIADIIVSANSLKNSAKEEVKQVTDEQQAEDINAKMQNLINQFKTTKK